MGYGGSNQPVDFSYRRLRLHPESGALSHWPMQGDATDSIGSNDIGGNHQFQKVNGFANDDLVCSSIRDTSTYNATSNSPDIKNLPAITVAAWVSIAQEPGANLSIVGMRGPGSGATYNFPWELGYETGVGARFFWQAGTKSYEGTISQPIALSTWHHLIGTRNSTQDTARLYINGALANEVTGLSPWAGGANQNTVRFFTQALSNNLNGQFFSPIVYPTFTDIADAKVLYESTIETVSN